MNRLFAYLVEELNAVLAVLITLSGGVTGHEYARLFGESVTAGTCIGLIIGAFSAVVTCGAIALLASCERYLRYIASDLEDRRLRERAAGKQPHL